jgi:hypothetical protein
MRRIYTGGVPNFNTGQVISKILERMYSNGQLHQFSNDPTKYYIEKSSLFNGNKEGTGWVVDLTDSTNPALVHMDVNDIPYW